MTKRTVDDATLALWRTVPENGGDLKPKQVLALIDELTEARRERDEAKRREGDANEHLDYCVVARRERDEAVAALAKAEQERDALAVETIKRGENLLTCLELTAEKVAAARAVAMADAANAIVSSMMQVETGLTIKTLAATADMIRALAPLEASLVAVPKEAREQAKTALELASRIAVFPPADAVEAGQVVEVFRAALTALSAEVKP